MPWHCLPEHRRHRESAPPCLRIGIRRSCRRPVPTNIPQAARHLLCFALRQHSVRPVVSIARWIPKFSLSAARSRRHRTGAGRLPARRRRRLDGVPCADAARALGLRRASAPVPARDARPAHRDRRHRRTKSQCRGTLALGSRQAGADAASALRTSTRSAWWASTSPFPRRTRVPAFRFSKRSPGANCATTRRSRPSCSGRAPSLDYDRRFAEEIGKGPVVLGFLVSPQRRSIGCPAAPGVRGERSRERGVPPFQRLGLQRQHCAAAGGRDRRGTSVARARPGRCHAQRADVHAGRATASSRRCRWPSFASTSATRRSTSRRPSSTPAGDRRDGSASSASATRCAFRSTRGWRRSFPTASQGGFRYVSATDVIRGTLGADELKDRIVIVGTSARGLVDVRATPTREDLPGVEIHASLISGALDNAMKSRPAEMLAIAVLTILLVGIPLAVLLPRLSALAATLVVAGRCPCSCIGVERVGVAGAEPGAAAGRSAGHAGRALLPRRGVGLLRRNPITGS